MAEFTYMGTKKLLAPRIADLAAMMAHGPFLDLFSGIAAVGAAIGTDRPVWSNDVQQFSTLLTRQRFRAARSFTRAHEFATLALPLFDTNCAALRDVFASLLHEEDGLLRSTSALPLRDLIDRTITEGAILQPALRAAGWHCQFATIHAGTYFGLGQAIAIDSIRHAADKLLAEGRIDEEDHGWMVLALCQAAATASNSTGHFAQYLSPNDSNINRVLRKRRMDIWTLWQGALLGIKPAGTVAWRRRNRVFNTDAVALLQSMAGQSRQPAVIYADPPYTNDQYSRYYHLLENIVLYDYPVTAGKGQYRPDRFTSGFSLKSSVNRSFVDLVEAAAELRSVFVLSYPTNGLLEDSTQHVLDILRSRFAHVEVPHVIPHMHSTMGGSKGAQKHAVDENIFIASQQWEMRHAYLRAKPVCPAAPRRLRALASCAQTKLSARVSA